MIDEVLKKPIMSQRTNTTLLTRTAHLSSTTDPILQVEPKRRVEIENNGSKKKYTSLESTRNRIYQLTHSLTV